MGYVVKALFGAVGQPGVDRLARYLTDWLAGSNARLQRTAAQVHTGIEARGIPQIGLPAASAEGIHGFSL